VCKNLICCIIGNIKYVFNATHIFVIDYDI
jgi:hypothetical protein